jgi:aspartokinase
MAKIQVHNILCAGEQALITLRLDGHRAGFLPSILYAFREERIPLSFTLLSFDPKGDLILTLILRSEDLGWARAALREGLDLPSIGSMEIRDRAALITLYGPHLGEKPGVAARMIFSLAKDGVEVLALSASINSCLLLVPGESSSRALQSLRRVFEIPPG